jgi:hypothetical protein
MADVTSDSIGDALRADAEAARAEMRETGLVCPSCEKSLGDLYGRGHRYDDSGNGTGVPSAVLNLQGTFNCIGGEPVDVASLEFEQIRAVANIGFLDAFWKAESDLMDERFIGTREGSGFTGLLDSL